MTLFKCLLMFACLQKKGISFELPIKQLKCRRMLRKVSSLNQDLKAWPLSLKHKRSQKDLCTKSESSSWPLMCCFQEGTEHIGIVEVEGTCSGMEDNCSEIVTETSKRNDIEKTTCDFCKIQFSSKDGLLIWMTSLPKFNISSGLLAFSHRSGDQPLKMPCIDSFG